MREAEITESGALLEEDQSQIYGTQMTHHCALNPHNIVHKVNDGGRIGAGG